MDDLERFAGRLDRFFALLIKAVLVCFIALIVLSYSSLIILYASYKEEIASFGADKRYVLLRKGLQDTVSGTKNRYVLRQKGFVDVSWSLHDEWDIFDNVLTWEFRDGKLFVLTARYQAVLDTGANRLRVFDFSIFPDGYVEWLRSYYEGDFTLIERTGEFTAEEQGVFARLKEDYKRKQGE